MKQFLGRWKILEMETWDRSYIDLVEPGYFRFEDDGMGEFVFGAVKGFIDARYSDAGDKVDYSWQGVCEGDDYCGRGWFVLESPSSASGRIFIHCGDESGISIGKET